MQIRRIAVWSVYWLCAFDVWSSPSAHSHNKQMRRMTDRDGSTKIVECSSSIQIPDRSRPLLQCLILNIQIPPHIRLSLHNRDRSGWGRRSLFLSALSSTLAPTTLQQTDKKTTTRSKWQQNLVNKIQPINMGKNYTEIVYNAHFFIYSNNGDPTKCTKWQWQERERGRRMSQLGWWMDDGGNRWSASLVIVHWM